MDFFSIEDIKLKFREHNISLYAQVLRRLNQVELFAGSVCLRIHGLYSVHPYFYFTLLSDFQSLFCQ